eukprot:Plantae.Rhodophyta-Purpureofilum_apyrenoidigerum.ctg397.p1 GENE.Plantae.Rhodophyta-Purpureofilum_apyrenoidigerum.ctg397~~Plantae.Rhodophyta-Purpureofilum_apyrenoidigerum.ctg397.p1  ORF type:complete len:346 (+),score=48.75 Plantae.Rhodophyta-Purpureofilum_apyrenoidigerum.ctg397:81-1040(+)
MALRSVHNMREYDSLLQGAGRKVVVVDFFATWCGPCRAVAPHVENLARQYAQVSVFAKVDCDAAREVAQHCSIQAMPTFHVYSQGRLVEEIVGANVSRIESALQRYAPKVMGPGHRLGDSNGGSGEQASGPKIQWDAPAKRREGRKVAATKSAVTASKSDVRYQDAQSGTVDNALLKQLVDMGFDEATAKESLVATNNESLARAVDFISLEDKVTENPNPEGAVGQSEGLSTNSVDPPLETGMLLLRLPDGGRLELAITSADTLGSVWTAVEEIHPDIAKAGFKLVQQYPQKVYTAANANVRLSEENLTKRAQLRLVPL